MNDYLSRLLEKLRIYQELYKIYPNGAILQKMQAVQEEIKKWDGSL